MHTGIISFCDRVAYNIKSNDIKDIILNNLFSLYNIRIIQKHYHKVDEQNIQYIKKLPHLICLRTNGNPYYMFFTKYNDIPIIYFIDKKIHPGYQKPRIILARGMFDISLFENTLLDGEMVKNKDNKWSFIINDIIGYENKFLNKVSLPERLKIIYNLLENKYTPDNIFDVCNYKIKTYYNTYKESIDELINISKILDYTCRGIYFWSYDLKHKPKLYNFNEEIIIDVVRITKDNPVFKTFENNADTIKQDKEETSASSKNESENIISSIIPPIISPIIPPIIPPIISDISSNTNINDAETRVLWITKTDEPDVYNVYDNENTLTTQKLGIALVPTLQISKMIRMAFREKNAATIIKFKCIFNNKFNKWEPREHIVK
jgi:hypothetical protein